MDASLFRLEVELGTEAVLPNIPDCTAPSEESSRRQWTWLAIQTPRYT